MLKYLLPDEVEVNITIVDNGAKSNPTTNKTFRFTKNLYFIVPYLDLLSLVQALYVILKVLFNWLPAHTKMKNP